MTDLRTLAQAFADAVPLTAAYYRHRAALADALDGAVPTQHVARAILAVYAQGYARAMGEVEAAMDAASDEALAEYQARRSDYRDGFCDGLCEAYRNAQNTAKAARERAAAASR